MTLVRELIELPEKVHGGDFVLKLTEGVAHPEATLRDYVVTPQLAECFDGALEFIHSALVQGQSKAAYLHGSFGSGKSHFMAVLHLLLQQVPAARAMTGLEGVVTAHDGWLEGKKFLLVPYHMIGQPSLEAAILGGYVRKVRELHPEAPIPGVYRAEGLFHDAAQLRESMGDESFFEQLNGSSAGGDGWGELEGGWDAERFEAALAAAPGSEERSGLVGALVEGLFQSYQKVLSGSGEAFVSMDEGLGILSRHAQELGYDGLVLFLDELILWLATHAADQSFLNAEGSKVSKLVEGEFSRTIPIVSFVARQRDLRELVGDSVTGAEQLGFEDVLRWWAARFETFTLEDRNLPEIAARRVLRPKSEAARQQIEQAWQETEKIRDEVLDVLLTQHADRSVFRKVYPFSPALVETLVAVSSALQRERTALKVMLQLLVNQRETLALGEIVPVGDLFDVIAEGDEPFTEGMRLHFENAKRLYLRKLLPLLEKEHGVVRDEVVQRPWDDSKYKAFRADDRLLKTLLLAALVPEVEVLRGLNAARLAALNHGSITAPIAGRERQEVLRRLKSWASQVGEIKLGEGDDPSVTLQLSGVDTEGILANVQSADNAGNRLRRVKELLFEQLGIPERNELIYEHEIQWRGSRRTFQVLFSNVRELSDDRLHTVAGARKVIVDYPFDQAGHSPSEDVARLDEYRQSREPARTLVWLPAFLSLEAQKDLGRLVQLEEVLRSDESFRSAASHLSEVDRAQARALLDNQRTQLRQRMIGMLEGAYGVAKPPPGTVDESHRPADHFQSLDPSLTPQVPAGGTLRQAFEQLLQQMLETQYPAHPHFGMEVRIAALEKVLGQVSQAIQAGQDRIPIDKPLRPFMLQIAVPLLLGEMGETHFVPGRHWYQHLQRVASGEGPLTVGRLRAALDQPQPMGLPRAVQNLVIVLFAQQTDRSFVLHGGPIPPSLKDLADEVELREQKLPSAEVWEAVVDRGGKLFGVAVSPLRNAANAAQTSAELASAAREAVEACQAVVDRLGSLLGELKAPADAPRLVTARAVHRVVLELAGCTDSARLQVLAEAEIGTSLAAMGSAFGRREEVRRTLASAKWTLFDGVARLQDERREAAGALRRQLVEALCQDEYVVALRSRLERLEGEAVRLLAYAAPSPQPDEIVDGLHRAMKKEGRIVGERGAIAARKVRELAEEVAANPDLELELHWKLLAEKDE